MLLVVTKACRQSSVNTFTRQLGQSCRISIGNSWQRKELQNWRSLEIPWQQKSSWLQVGKARLTSGLQAPGIQRGDCGKLGLVGLGSRVKLGGSAFPFSQQGATLFSRTGQHVATPARIILIQQWQVEEPLTGVVEQIETQFGGFAAQQAASRRTIADR